MKLTMALALLVTALPLGGCVASMAASAVSMAVKSARGQAKSNEGQQPAAVQACTTRAEQHGTVKVIDVEQRSTSKIIVYGTAGEDAARRSFECSYGTKITGFRLRAIKPLPQAF